MCILLLCKTQAITRSRLMKNAQQCAFFYGSKKVKKEIIQTGSAPGVMGCYSQAVVTDHLIYLSGQIPLDPVTMQIVSNDIKEQVIQVFNNLQAVALAAGATLDDMVKLTVYVTDINYSVIVNEVMREFFKEPYPARTSIAVVALPKGALVEIDGFIARSAVV
jgi:reactive intermediate/imine deaminase